MRKRTMAGVAALVVLAGGVGGWAGSRSGDEPAALTTEEMCDLLREVDPGPALGSGNLRDRAGAVVVLGEVADRAPDDLRGALAVLAAQADAEPLLADFPTLEPGDDDYGLAYQAAYQLSFDSQVTVAGGLVERYAVDTCGMEASGLFDIDAVRDSDLRGADIPVLTQEQLEQLRVSFDGADFSEFELEPFEIPPVEFNEDFGEFQLDLPEMRPPDL